MPDVKLVAVVAAVDRNLAAASAPKAAPTIAGLHDAKGVCLAVEGLFAGARREEDFGSVDH